MNLVKAFASAHQS